MSGLFSSRPTGLRSDLKRARAEESLKRLLKSSPQDLWLEIIRRANWRVHDTLVAWILNQTECDFAIAAHAFYRSDPAGFLDKPRPLPAQPSPADTFAIVLQNWDMGYYRHHALMVEPRDANPRLVARVNQKFMARPKRSLPFNIPPRLLKPVGGAPINLPEHLSPDNAAHLWRICHDLGLEVPAHAPGLARRLASARLALSFVAGPAFRP